MRLLPPLKDFWVSFRTQLLPSLGGTVTIIAEKKNQTIKFKVFFWGFLLINERKKQWFGSGHNITRCTCTHLTEKCVLTKTNFLKHYLTWLLLSLATVVKWLVLFIQSRCVTLKKHILLSFMLHGLGFWKQIQWIAYLLRSRLIVQYGVKITMAWRCQF